MKIKENNFTKRKLFFLYLKYKIFIHVNRFFISNRIVFRNIIFLRFSKRIEKLHQYNIKERISNNKKDILKSIEDTYFSTERKKRVYISDYIDASFMVAETAHKLKKSQPRNKPCDCGSGKKFKRCCYLNYI